MDIAFLKKNKNKSIYYFLKLGLKPLKGNFQPIYTYKLINKSFNFLKLLNQHFKKISAPGNYLHTRFTFVGNGVLGFVQSQPSDKKRTTDV